MVDAVVVDVDDPVGDVVVVVVFPGLDGFTGVGLPLLPVGLAPAIAGKSGAIALPDRRSAIAWALAFLVPI